MPDQTFTPRWASPPGDTVRDLLRKYKISESQLSSEISASAENLENLLTGRTRITPTIADNLSHTLGGSRQFWINRDSQYLIDLEQIEASQRDWLRSLPLADMVRLGWIDVRNAAEANLATCLAFFQVKSLEEWEAVWLNLSNASATFRTSPTFQSDANAVAAWLRQGEIQAESLTCTNSWNKEQFKHVLPEIRALSREREPRKFLPQLQEMCRGCGVALVIVKAPKGCKASGAARLLTPKKALIQLSFRYLSDDHFWFTFFHEVGHLLLHKGDAFIDIEGQTDSQQETEANDYAANFLIPQEHLTRLKAARSDVKKILRLAQELKIAPGIVVGQMQHRGILARNRMNSLKRHFAWPIG